MIVPSAVFQIHTPDQTRPAQYRFNPFRLRYRTFVRYMVLAAVWIACLGAAQEGGPVANFGTTVVISAGLKGNIYHISHFTKNLSDLTHKKPKWTIYTTSLNVPPTDFSQGFPGVTDRFEWFAIDYSGRFWIEKPGLYRFALLSDDGSQLLIDGKMVINNGGIHPPQEILGEVRLNRGVHEIHVPYFQGPKFHVALVLRMAGPGQAMRIFNTDEMKPPPDAFDSQ